MRSRLHGGLARMGVALGAVFILVAGGFTTAQGAVLHPAAKPVTLTFWEGNTTDPQLKAAMSAYHKEHPNVKFAISTLPGTSYDTKVNLAMKSGKVPDIFENHGGGLLFAQFLPGHQLVDLGKLIPQLKENYLPTVLDPITSKGQIYAMPYTGTQPDAIFYNKSDFQKAGISGPPSTWAQFLKDVKTLKQHGMIPIAEGNETWAEMMWPQYIATKLGGPAFGQSILTNKPDAWSQTPMTRALSLTEQLLKLQPFEPGYQGIQWGNGEPTQLVASGQAAMELQGAWEVGNMQEKTPSFAKSTDLGYFAFPKVPGATSAGEKNVAGNPATYVSVPTKAPDKQAAIDFMKFFTTKKFAGMVLKAGQVPGTKTGGASIKTAKLDKVTRAWDNFAFQQVQKAPYFQQSWDQYLSAGISTEMTTDIGKLFAGSMTPGQLTKDLDSTEANAG
ncbi:MAG: extracellular solute-binding protein [Candidatus Dormibacteraeota bacterium]|nr:extracellular solute-binding protein [Candidatus Dormibacteraeota bacterium]